MAAELIGIEVTSSLENPRARLTYKVSGLTAGDDDDNNVRAQLSFTNGSLYPLSNLPAICKDITIVEWWSPTVALVQATFGTTRFSLYTRVIASYDIDLKNIDAPYYSKLVGTQAGQIVQIGWVRNTPIKRVRGVIRKYDYRQTSGQIPDAEADFIASQVGKGYVLGSIPYIFVGASATVSSNNQSIIRYAFATTASVKELVITDSMRIPALAPLEVYREPIDDPAFANMRIGVVSVADNYEDGEPLP